jgi:hypothetical protein
MRIATVRMVALILATAAVGAACGGSDAGSQDAMEAGREDARPDVVAPRPDVAVDVPVDMPVAMDVRPDVPQDTARVCLPRCTSDMECQTTCPSVASGSNCCDTRSGICYVSPGMCPTAVRDGGMPPLY